MILPPDQITTSGTFINLSRVSGICVIDGCIEFMTLGEQHENIKKIIAILIEAYLFEKGINFIPHASWE